VAWAMQRKGIVSTFGPSPCPPIEVLLVTGRTATSERTYLPQRSQRLPGVAPFIAVANDQRAPQEPLMQAA
jgi:hypothetical protein